MLLVRTTLRLEKQVKLEAERYALEQERTLQDVFNEALKQYVQKKTKKKLKKMKFITHDFGVPLDNLTRDFYYDDPR